MATATLKAVGGSVMFAIPKYVLEDLHMGVDQRVQVSVSDGRMIVEPDTKPRYTLAELLAQCDFDQPMTDQDREWLDQDPVGREVW